MRPVVARAVALIKFAAAARARASNPIPRASRVHRPALVTHPPSPTRSLAAAADKEAEHVIRRTLEQVVLTATHPRLGVTVVLQIVSADGAVESCALNATCAALLDAAVPMRGVLCAATCAHLPDVGPVADPTEDEERDALAVATHAFCFRGGETGAAPPAARPEAEAEVLQTTSRGVFAADEDFMTLAVLARDAAASVFRFHREAVERMARGDEERDEALRRRAEKAAAVARERAGAGGGHRRSFGGTERGNAETAETGA